MNITPSGHLYYGDLAPGDRVATPQEISFNIKAEMWEKIKELREIKKNQGFFALGKWFHSDLGSKIQHLGNKDSARDQMIAGSQASAPLIDPSTGAQILWKTLDGSLIGLTCQAAIDIVAAAKATEFNHHRIAEIHKMKMSISQNPGAYDYTVDWVSVYGGTI